MGFKHILLTTDFSEHAEKSIQYVAKNVIDKETRGTILAVVENVIIPYWYAAAIPAYTDDLVKNAREKVHHLAEEYLAINDIQEKVTVSFNVPQEICDIAEREGCDAIFMASHGVGALLNLFIGSTVQRVIHLAKCPVIVIPQGC